MTKRLSDFQVERYIGQTPCLCGSLTTWHPKCYQSKDDKTIKIEQAAAMKIARAAVARHFREKAERVISRIRGIT